MSSRVNEVNGENLQDPPIKNPGYVNGLRLPKLTPVSLMSMVYPRQLTVTTSLSYCSQNRVLGTALHSRLSVARRREAVPSYSPWR